MKSADRDSVIALNSLREQTGKWGWESMGGTIPFKTD
jgi:hypothetical protein